MSIQIQSRRDTAANWTSGNPTLANGELGLETDTGLWKVGNGSTAWTSLAYGPAPKGYVDQPPRRSVSGTTDTVLAADIGGVVMYSQAGGVTVDLPTLAASLIANKALVLTLQATNAATIITVDPGTSVTIDGSGSNYVAATGKSRVSLISVDGLAWYSGTP